MMTGPGGENAAPGRGHLRASHADREQVIEALKAAFVQGRLTKGELDARAGQAFAARTYADLGALTADLPAGPPGATPPRRPVPAQGRRSMSNVPRSGMCVVIVIVVSAVLSFPTGGAAFLLFTPFFFMALAVFVAETLVSRLDKRSPRRRLPPADPGHQHTAEAAGRRRARRSSPAPRSPHRWCCGHAAGPMSTFRP